MGIRRKLHLKWSNSDYYILPTWSDSEHYIHNIWSDSEHCLLPYDHILNITVITHGQTLSITSHMVRFWTLQSTCQILSITNIPHYIHPIWSDSEHYIHPTRDSEHYIPHGKSRNNKYFPLSQILNIILRTDCILTLKSPRFSSYVMIQNISSQNFVSWQVLLRRSYTWNPPLILPQNHHPLFLL